MNRENGPYYILNSTRAYEYTIPHDESKLVHTAKKTALVSGAGPAGLMSAIVLKQKGLKEVVVVEKRQVYNRMNFINFEKDALCLLKDLGYLRRFEEIACRIHKIYNYAYEKNKLVETCQSDGQTLHDIKTSNYESEKIDDLFNNESAYSTSIAELQNLLTEIATECGVKILKESHIKLVKSQNDFYSAYIYTPNSEYFYETPNFIIVSEGLHSQTVKDLGVEYKSSDYQEAWVFGNVLAEIDEGQVGTTVNYDFEKNTMDLSNCIFHKERQELNVALASQSHKLTQKKEVAFLIKQQAKQICENHAIHSKNYEICWFSKKPVTIYLRKAKNFIKGNNVFLVGDAAGSGSPLAGLGASLAISAYPFALGKIVEEKNALGQERAFDLYSERLNSYVDKWHKKTSLLKKEILGRKVKDRIYALSHDLS